MVKTISKEGFDNLLKELKHLKEVERPDIIATVQWAKSLGDLSENADYSIAKEKQRNIDSRINYLENIISDAEVIDTENLKGDKVTFGAKVIIEDENGQSMQCRILSDIESDGKTIIACTSPLGRSLIGKCVGDVCIVRLPNNEKEYEIKKIEF